MIVRIIIALYWSVTSAMSLLLCQCAVLWLLVKLSPGSSSLTPQHFEALRTHHNSHTPPPFSGSRSGLVISLDPCGIKYCICQLLVHKSVSASIHLFVEVYSMVSCNLKAPSITTIFSTHLSPCNQHYSVCVFFPSTPHQRSLCII